ncbi:helicase POLQ-like isoform X2 [Scylla paramamosain]|uniref:helicase POLQ-like isoform X2 n=1 Tax=Scylla paramamosain TaxID=85552 RepID=UPI0030837B68
MNDTGKRVSEGLCSPSVDRVNKWEGVQGNEENCSPFLTSSPLLCRKVKKIRKFKLTPEKPMKQEQSISSRKCAVNDSNNESSLLIKDDSFINHMNFEKLDQLSATDDQSSIAPAPPLSPELFEEPSPIKTYESQGSILPTQASLSSTLSSQPLVTRIQRNFRREGEQFKCEVERRKEEMVAALEECACSSNQAFNLGPFFGLSSHVLELLKIHRGITKLYEWQEDCIIKGGTGFNLLISMPTSGGKTLVAEVLIWQQLLLKNHNALFILPYVALVQEKVRDLAPFGVELDFLVEEYASSRGSYPPIKHKKKRIVYVATIEKASGLVNSLLSEDRIKELGLVVVDEVHMVGETGGRGATLENLLTILRYAAPSVQMVGMSATVGNVNELAEFLGAETYENNFRPVHLIEYVMMEQQLCEVNKKAKTETDLFIKNRTCTFNSRDHIGVLVEEMVPEHSCLVFCPTKLWSENEALNICKVLPKKLKQVAYQKKKALLSALQEEGGQSVCPILRKTIPYGIAYHHSGLTDAERHLLEEAYLQGTICIICCTSTLAAGINLPARRVIIRSPYTGRVFLTQAKYKQMVGRAGRAGLSSAGESFLIIEKQNLNQARKMLLSSVDKCVSTLAEDEYHGLATLLFSSVGLGVAVSLPELKALASRSLLALQALNLNVDVSAMVVDIVEKLRDMELVCIKQEIDEISPAQSLTEDSKLNLPKKSSEASTPQVFEKLNRPVEDGDTLTVSKLGRAAIKGNVKYTVAQELYSDLLEARERLSVNTYLHLMYLVIPYENVRTVKMNPSVFDKAHSLLGKEELKLANTLRINEGTIARMMSGKKIKAVKEEVLKRFYCAMKLHITWCKQGMWEASVQLGCERGELQQLLNATTSFACCVSHFCAELEQLWAFRDLLVNITQMLSGCCTAELMPLLDLPGVKKGRAKLMYKAGLKTLQDVAKCEPRRLMQAVIHLSYVSALQIIHSAKMLLIDKAQVLQMEAEEIVMGMTPPFKLSSGIYGASAEGQ